MKFEIDKYGSTLENKGVKPGDILTHGWIGHHSCGSSNIGDLDLTGFSDKQTKQEFNAIICSHCHEPIKIPKSLKTFGDLENYFEEKLTIKKINLHLLKKNGKLDGRVLTIKLNKKGYKTFTLLRLRRILKKQMKINLSYIFEECKSKQIIFSLVSNGDFCFIISHYENCLFVQATELVMEKERTLYDGNMLEIAGKRFQVKF